jgi:hypothetical protein
MKMPSFLIPHNQNNTQRVGLVVTLIGMVVFVFLHNPIGGYKTMESKFWADEVINPKCTKEEVAWAKRVRLMANRPIEEWEETPGRSDAPPEGIATWPYSKQVDWKYSFVGQANSIIHRCVDIRSGTFDERLPFSDWKSISPLVDWLGSVINLLEALFAIAMAGMIWLFVFQQERDAN